jgi:hypothetical protein
MTNSTSNYYLEISYGKVVRQHIISFLQALEQAEFLSKNGNKDIRQIHVLERKGNELKILETFEGRYKEKIHRKKL